MTTINNINNIILQNNFSVTVPAASGSVYSLTNNSSNTGSSVASQIISTAGTTAGDCYTRFSVGTTAQYAIGLNSSASNNLYISYAASGAVPSSGLAALVLESSGYFYYQRNSAFNVYLNVTVNNVTGDGTLYTFVPDTTFFDVMSNVSGGTFTAPVTGIYYFANSTGFSGWGAQTNAETRIVTSSRTLCCNYFRWGIIAIASLTVKSCSCIAKMTAGDTCVIQMYAEGSTKTVGLCGAGDALNCFSGYLAC